MEIGDSISEKELVLGRNDVLKKLRSGGLKKIICSGRVPRRMKEKLKKYSEVSGVEFEEFDGSPKELGTECKRPHIVSVVGIKE